MHYSLPNEFGPTVSDWTPVTDVVKKPRSSGQNSVQYNESKKKLIKKSFAKEI